MSDVSRRTFLTASAAAGFALAVRPISAATILTESTGLEAGEVSIPAADRSIYRFAPIPRAASETIYHSGATAGIFSTCRP